MLKNKFYYSLKPFIPRRIQIFIRRILISHKRSLCHGIWPIDEAAKKKPDSWSGWPDRKRFALVLTHDVESSKGVNNCLKLARLEERLGFRSSFNFVIKDYHLPSDIRHTLTAKGFEVGVHGYTHDGRELLSRKSFLKHVPEINQHLKEWGAVGYRSPSMLGNLEWIHNLNIEYDASTFDTDPFEPKPSGAHTIFPHWIAKNTTGKGYVELPYTLAQDFTLFILMQEKSPQVWEKKLDWIMGCRGMALLNTHPDYMNFGDKALSMEEYPIAHYERFLQHIKDEFDGQYWHALPREMALYWKKCKLS